MTFFIEPVNNQVTIANSACTNIVYTWINYFAGRVSVRIHSTACWPPAVTKPPTNSCSTRTNLPTSQYFIDTSCWHLPNVLTLWSYFSLFVLTVVRMLQSAFRVDLLNCTLYSRYVGIRPEMLNTAHVPRLKFNMLIVYNCIHTVCHLRWHNLVLVISWHHSFKHC